MRNIGIVGGGIGGLTLACLLAKRGHAVTVYEREELGGKLGRIDLAGQAVDTGPSLFTFPGVWRRVVERLEQRDPLQLTPLPNLGVHVIGEERFPLPVPAGHWLYPHWARYVREVGPLRPHMEALLTTPPDLRDARFRAASAALLRVTGPHARAHAWLGARNYPAALRRALAVHALNAGVGPRAGSSLYALLPALIAGDVHRPAGGMAALVRVLITIARESGVTLLPRHPVERIDAEHGTVHLPGYRAAHDLLVSAVDPTRLGPLLGRAVRARALSVSGFTLYALTGESLPLPVTTIIPPTDDQAFERAMAVRAFPPDTLALVHYERERRVLSVLLTAPPNGQTLSLEHPWVAGQFERVEKLLNVPLRRALTARAAFDPAFFARGGALGGAIYGRVFPAWRSGPLHPERYRLGERLWQVGSGVHPGGGLPAVLGGALIVDELLARVVLR